MTTSKGPWKVVNTTAVTKKIGIECATGVIVAMMSRRGQETTMADALLIAAAPDQRDALRALLTRYVELVDSGDAGNWDSATDPEVIAARAALAKAER